MGDSLCSVRHQLRSVGSIELTGQPDGLNLALFKCLAFWHRQLEDWAQPAFSLTYVAAQASKNNVRSKRGEQKKQASYVLASEVLKHSFCHILLVK